MGLKGRLEEFQVLDVIQIAAYLQRSGYLRVEGLLGSGAVVFKQGLVLCAYSWSTLEHLRLITRGEVGSLDEAVLGKHVEISLRDLARLPKGEFVFQPADEVAPELDGVDISPFVQHGGFLPQQLLLDLARNLDEERRDAMALLEAPQSLLVASRPAVPRPPAVVTKDPAAMEPRIDVVLVDDERDILDIVGKELESRGFGVLRAAGPVQGAALVQERLAADEPLVVVTDLKMPTSTGDSFRGGFELVERLNRSAKRAPVLLMSEGLSPDDRERAIELGIRKAAFKPTLTKPDPEQYREDLKAFAAEIERQLEILSSQTFREESTPSPTEAAPKLLLDYLASMAHQILSPHRRTQVTRIVLQVAARYLERGILFLVKEDRACGVAAFGISENDAESRALSRKIEVELSQAEPFAEVMRSKDAYGPTSKLDTLEVSLYARVGRGEAREAILMPMLNNGEVLAILYGDNVRSGRRLVKPRGLELMMAQAGMALENALLQRKLKSLRERFPSKTSRQERRGTTASVPGWEGAGFHL